MFCSELDEHIALNGPAGLFKLNSDQELVFDIMRSRRIRADNVGPVVMSKVHCLLIDKKTKWPQYALITSKALIKTIVNCDVVTFPTMSDALDAVEKQKIICYAAASD